MFLPYRLLKKTLLSLGCSGAFMAYLRKRKKIDIARLREKFLKKCVQNDIIPRFLKFRVPENGCFVDSIVHAFQKKLLKTEINTCVRHLRKHEEDLRQLRYDLIQACPRHLLPSICLYVKMEVADTRKQMTERHDKKLSELSKAQEKPLRRSGNNVITIGDIKLPTFVTEFLSLGPRHPVVEKFDEMPFLAAMDNCMSQLKEKEAINELNSSAMWYRKAMKQSKPDKTLIKVKQFLKEHNLKSVPFDKGLGFCVMSDELYNEKLTKLMDGPQFKKLQGIGQDILLKAERELNGKLNAFLKDGKIDQKFYDRSRSCGAQPAKLYGLAKINKKGASLRPVLSLPGSCYENLTSALAELIEDVEGAGIETSTQKIKEDINTVH